MSDGIIDDDLARVRIAAATGRIRRITLLVHDCGDADNVLAGVFCTCHVEFDPREWELAVTETDKRRLLRTRLAQSADLLLDTFERHEMPEAPPLQ